MYLLLPSSNKGKEIEKKERVYVHKLVLSLHSPILGRQLFSAHGAKQVSHHCLTTLGLHFYINQIKNIELSESGKLVPSNMLLHAIAIIPRIMLYTCIPLAPEKW